MKKGTSGDRRQPEPNRAFKQHSVLLQHNATTTLHCFPLTEESFSSHLFKKIFNETFLWLYLVLYVVKVKCVISVPLEE